MDIRCSTGSETDGENAIEFATDQFFPGVRRGEFPGLPQGDARRLEVSHLTGEISTGRVP
jgi:hypothetical protein